MSARSSQVSLDQDISGQIRSGQGQAMPDHEKVMSRQVRSDLVMSGYARS